MLARLKEVAKTDIDLVVIARTVSEVGDGIVPVALSFAVLDLTGSPADLAIVFAARSVTMILLMLCGGVFADRLSPRTVMVNADQIRAAALIVMSGLLIGNVATVATLALLYAMEGAASAFFMPASTAIVPQIVEQDALHRAYSSLATSKAVGRIAGPVIGGIAIAVFSPGAGLAGDALSFTVSAILLRRLRGGGRRAGGDSSFVRELREGWNEFRSRSWMVALVISAAITNALFFPAFQVLGPTVAKASWDGASSWGLVFAAFGVGAVCGSMLARRIRPSRPLLVGEASLVLFALPIALLAWPAPVVLVALGALFTGVALSVAEILYETVAASRIPTDVMSRVIAYDWFGSLAIEPLGFIAIGSFATSFGVSATLAVVAALLLIVQTSVLLVPSVRKLESVVAVDASPHRRS